MQIVRHRLCDDVHVGVAHAEHAADVSDDRLGGERSESDNAAYMVAPVLFGDVIDDLAASVITEIRVEVGHADALRIEKPLEHQMIFD